MAVYQNRERYRQTGRQIGRQTDKQTDRQTASVSIEKWIFIFHILNCSIMMLSLLFGF